MTATSVVIVNWNSGPHLARAVASLVAITDAIDAIVVVDNASTDDSLAEVDTSDSRVRIVRNATNTGFAGGINRGARETSGPYMLVLNPDVQVQEGAVNRLRRLLEDRPRIGAAGGFVNERYWPRPFPTPVSLIVENLGLGARTLRGPGVEGLRVDQPAASALMIRREAFDAVGGFDDQFFPAWYEDVDFATALATHGWTCWYDPAARFDHDGGYSLNGLGNAGFMMAYYANQFRYVRKRIGAGWVVPIKIALAIGTLGRMIRRPAEAGSYWQGLGDVLGQ